MSTSTSFSPAGAASGFDTEVMNLIDSANPPHRFLRRFVYNAATGAIVSFADTELDGTTAYAPTGTVGPDVGELFLNVQAHHFDALPGTPWTAAAIPAGTLLVALSYSVVLGTATVVDADGTSVATIPTGFSGQWNAQNDREVLTPPTSITPAAASRVLVTMSVRTT